MFVNLGDKRSGSGGHNNNGLGSSTLKNDGRKNPRPDTERQQKLHAATRRNAPDRYNQAAFGRPKSKMALPHRYFIGCMDGHADPDGQGWIARQDIVWSKPNGLPESVTDRVRDSHEYWFHLTKSERYFSAVDEIREAYSPASLATYAKGGAVKCVTGDHPSTGNGSQRGDIPESWAGNPLGKLPGSVWTIPSEPLTVPDWLGVDHFAAFPQEWPRRLILGWTPTGICVECGQPRRPVVAKELLPHANGGHQGFHARGDLGGMEDASDRPRGNYEATITGYGCACPTPDAATRPAVVLDVFGGTGTTAMVARTLGRTGISLDLSNDYCRLAKWRIYSSGHAAKTRARTNTERQGDLFDNYIPRMTDVPTGGYL
jgi:hypothetical protein